MNQTRYTTGPDSRRVNKKGQNLPAHGLAWVEPVREGLGWHHVGEPKRVQVGTEGGVDQESMLHIVGDCRQRSMELVKAENIKFENWVS